MPDLLSQLRTFHDELEPVRRRVLYVAAAISLAVVVGVGFWASAPSYVLLTHASDADELSAVTRSLSEAGLPFRIDTDGLTVRVLEAQEIEARRASSGDRGFVGFEGLEQIEPWVTPFQEQLHRQRMMQGELVRTIDGIRGIASSTVHLDLPEPSAFLRDVAGPSAAVTLRPDAGATIDQRTARSVAQLVSSSVAGMQPEDITVVDASTGRTLWGGEGAGGGDAELASTANAREVALASGVRAALAQLLGRPDAVAVTVNVELETAVISQTVNAIDPLSSVAAKERVETQVDTRGGTASGGVPGTDSNVPERPANGSTGTGGSRTSETTDTTYQYTSSVTTTMTPAGAVRRLSASVMIDSAAVTKAAAGGDEAALKAQLESAVRAALGSTDKRADDVVVSFLPFSAPEALLVPEPASILTSGPLAEALVVLFAVALLVLFVVRPLVNAARPPPPVVVVPEPVPAPPLSLVDDDEEEKEEAIPLDLAARLRIHLSRLQPHHPRDLSDLVRQESEPSAEVVRRWLKNS
ncbi:MAG: flagellar basal-body MS-ring/collar protein FliF [Pseudomonadota bacterium]|nr:flagellar basal-body MS-ring/collar protein FliF [Pseudomonadota bacterium]